MLGRDGQAPPGLGRDAGDKSERDHGSEAADGEARPGGARSCVTALKRGRFNVQHCPGIVVRAGMVRVGIMGEHGELARIVGPVAQRVKVERASHRGCRRLGLNTGERIAESHAPPSLHVVMADTYRGRPPRIDMGAIKHRLTMGLSPTEIARELRISRGTVYKARADMTDIA